jgi:diguanylate cyclase (GGDEF)-like protein
LWLTSGSLLALLAALVLRLHAAARALRSETRARRRERWLRESTKTFFAAARRSSGAVLSALDGCARDFDARFDACLIFVPAGEELACAYASGSRCEHYRYLRLRRDDPHAIPSRAAALRCRVASDRCDGMLLSGDRYGIAVALHDGELRAVAYLSSAACLRNFDAEALVEALEAAAMPYGLALERENDRTDAMHDGLTGLLAPRAFRRTLHEVFAQIGTGASEAMLSLWFVDTDGFKAINDRFGHPAGDAVLQTMATLLKAHLIPGIDVGARNGGDEFCALIRNATKLAAVDRAARFLDAVRRHDFGLPATITASVGVASYPHDAATSSTLLELADAAMYFSKRNGRDRVSFVDAPGSFASVGAEAEAQPSRSPERWLSTGAASCMERSS